MASAPSHKNLFFSTVNIEQPLQIVSPAIEFVHLVEDDELLSWNFLVDDDFTVLGKVPIQIAAPCGRQPLGKCCLAHLPRTADENHLLREVFKNQRF